jgi:hypothetical protein
MAANLGLVVIPPISSDIPSDAVSVYNNLVNQLNVALQVGVTTAPSFGDQVVGGLAAANVAASILTLVELRCIANMLDPGTFGDRNVMRAEELFTLTSTPQTM